MGSLKVSTWTSRIVRPVLGINREGGGAKGGTRIIRNRAAALLRVLVISEANSPEQPANHAGNPLKVAAGAS